MLRSVAGHLAEDVANSVLHCADCATSYRPTAADAEPMFFLSDGTPSELPGSIAFLHTHAHHHVVVRPGTERPRDRRADLEEPIQAPRGNG
jgi:hypothetical protein